MLKQLAIALFLSVLTFSAFGQARLTVVNNSGRLMTVKVMRSTSNGKGRLFKKIQITANKSATVYFSTSGTYFTKTEAKVLGRDPIYKKGQNFVVHDGADGYSVLTLTFTIKESSIPQSSGQTISKSEFDQD